MLFPTRTNIADRVGLGITYDLIMSDEMKEVFQNCVPPIRPDHIAKLAIGQKKMSKFLTDVTFTEWENILSEIIVGDGRLFDVRAITALGSGRVAHLIFSSELRCFCTTPVTLLAWSFSGPAGALAR